MRLTNRVISAVVTASGGLLIAGGAHVPWGGPMCLQHERQKLTAADAAGGDQFAWSVSLNGDRAVVGAPSDDDAGSVFGSAYVFRRDDNGTPSDPGDDLWVQEAKLTASDAAHADNFGASVSISGDRAVVGAYQHQHPGSGHGSAYVFRRDDNGTPTDPWDDFWVEESELTASDAPAYENFADSVSISGDRAVVGASLDDDGGTLSGSAYVFRRDENSTPGDPSDDFWVEEAKLTASDAGPVDLFGCSVSISNDRAVIGARGDNDAGADSGSAYVFRRDDNGTPTDPCDDLWVEEAKLTASDAALGDEFGRSVSISGDRAVVGATGDDDAGSESGSAYVFRRDDNGTPDDPRDDFWVEEGKLTAPDAAQGDIFGRSVSICDDRAIVGAEQDDDAGSESGSAYVFRRDDNGTPDDPSDDFWGQEAKLTASDAAEEDIFSHSVSLSGDRAVVGAHWDDDAGTRSGSAYVFALGVDCNETGVPDECEIADGTSEDANNNGIPDECEAGVAGLDTNPGSCPNPVNPRSRGVVPMAIVGSESFDVTQVDVASLTLARADGVGGAVTPLTGPPGPGITIEDTATPFSGDLCDCHELTGDGMNDLLLKFSTSELSEALELGSLPGGTSVMLTLSGSLLDGTAFEASDCVLIRGSHPPVLVGSR